MNMMTAGNLPPQLPTLFHVTHYKAGSQWVREILKYACPERFIPQEYLSTQITRRMLIPGKVYAAVYLPRAELTRYAAPHRYDHLLHPTKGFLRDNYRHFVTEQRPVKAFVVLRDLRDTLVSLYFSRRYSHPLLDARQEKLRRYLEQHTLEEGLLRLLQIDCPIIAEIQRSWNHQQTWRGQPVLHVRYEDLIEEPYELFHQIITFCEIDIDRPALDAIVGANLFRNATGRQPGEEDVHAHLRKGIAGDWKNVFTPTVAAAVKQQYGSLLVETGYEKNMDW